jgi:hypothetical protein
MSHKRLFRSLVVTIVALAAWPLGALAAPVDRQTFNADMRKLWEDHITWTRLYIVDALAGLPEKGATAQRLLQNQVDLGNAIKPFYGDAAGTKLTSLLRDHILIAAELIDAAKAGDSAKKESATRRWFTNADDIAGFLSGANPQHWPADATRKMMHDHLDQTTQEVVAHLQKDWAADIAAYDRVHVQILSMADMLSSGIEAQFPSKFKS